jgi:hypothetical protein
VTFQKTCSGSIAVTSVQVLKKSRLWAANINHIVLSQVYVVANEVWPFSLDAKRGSRETLIIFMDLSMPP